jgi:aminoglycoside phosphotransferase (APT) family kinase protein
MTTGKMHSDEVDLDGDLARRLVAGQFPEWADLPIARVESTGTDNAIFRLGDELALRLPRRPSATAQVDKEQRWLPLLAPHLPLDIPTPLARGEPALGYPWRWSVCRWLDGVDALAADLAESRDAAAALAQFVNALRRVDASGGPPPGATNFYRGAPLVQRDPYVRRALLALTDDVDVAAAARVWDAALAAAPWDGSPTWIHGDLAPGNVLVRDGRVCAVIDFGCLGAGDPACDLMAAWNLFAGAARDVYRVSLAPDDETWARGRGWALSMALIAWPYYRTTNPGLVAQSRHTIEAVLSESNRPGGG